LGDAKGRHSAKYGVIIVTTQPLAFHNRVFADVFIVAKTRSHVARAGFGN
jgi:hypothetical protein